MSEWKFRAAEPADAEAFAKWSATNPQSDPQDLIAGTQSKNPTTVFFAVEKDGVVQVFAPLYAQMILAHLGFNPDADPKDKLRALGILLDGVSAFAVQYGVHELVTLSKEEYPIAQWALNHGFELDGRQLLKLDLNKRMEVVEV